VESGIYISLRIICVIMRNFLFCSFLDEFVEVMKKTTLNKRIPFDMNGGFVKLYFGKEKKRVVSYAEFSQFLHVIIFIICVLI